MVFAKKLRYTENRRIASESTIGGKWNVCGAACSRDNWPITKK